MPGLDSTADRNAPARSRRRRRWLPVFVASVCVLGVLIWVAVRKPEPTEAERYVSQVSVRGYQRVHSYIDPGTESAELRAAVAVFVGPPDGDVLSRVSGPGLVVHTPTNDPGFPGIEPVGQGGWHGCDVQINRWKTSDPPMTYYDLTHKQRAAFQVGQLSVLEIAVGCGGM